MNNIKYSPLGKVFNKGIQREDKKEDLLKRLKNIDDTTKYQIKIQLKPIENDLSNANTKAIKKLRFLNRLGNGAKKSLMKLSRLLYRACLCTYKRKDLWL